MKPNLPNKSRPRSNQDVINRVYKHFIFDGNEQCMSDNGSCVYRNSKGNGCAVGCMLPSKLAVSADECANSGEKDSTLPSVFARRPAVKDWFRKVKTQLLKELQFAHDGALSDNDMKREFGKVIKKHGLKVPVLTVNK